MSILNTWLIHLGFYVNIEHMVNTSGVLCLHFHLAREEETKARLVNWKKSAGFSHLGLLVLWHSWPPFYVFPYLELFALMCFYLFLCFIITIYMFFIFFLFFHIFSYFSYIFIFFICFVIFSYVGTWCGEHTSGEGASPDKWTIQGRRRERRHLQYAFQMSCLVCLRVLRWWLASATFDPVSYERGEKKLLEWTATRTMHVHIA